MTDNIKVWRLKSKEERRFKQGHPWVYSNELQESPKGITLGDWIELRSAGGDFLAFGFGNPNSLIAFRALSRTPVFEGRVPDDASIQKLFIDLMDQALRYRLSWFNHQHSFRMIYGEVDGLPGLVIDRYCSKKGIVYVVQPHAAGMDRHLDLITKALQSVHAKHAPTTQAVAVFRLDAGSREREGLEKLETQVLDLKTLDVIEDVAFLNSYEFTVQASSNQEAIMKVDLIGGQKTGYFFDQLENVLRVGSLLNRKKGVAHEFKILDLCSYVGQWSTQLIKARLALNPTAQIEVTCVDASDRALAFAEENIKFNSADAFKHGSIKFKRIKGDVLEPMTQIGNAAYEVVIADPPALIKSRKVMPQGKQAYVYLMTEAIKKTAPNGLVVCCSCSQLLSHDDFIEILEKATRRSGRLVRWIDSGQPSLDHPARFEFREGSYLKCWIGHVA